MLRKQQELIDQQLQKYYPNGLGSCTRIELSPVVEIDNKTKQFKLTVNVANFKPENVLVHIIDHEILIQADRCKITESSTKICQMLWVKHRLPFGLTEDDIQQSIKDGILTVIGAKKGRS